MTCDNPKVIHDQEILYKPYYSTEHEPGVKWATAFALCLNCGWRRAFAGWSNNVQRELDAISRDAARHNGHAPLGTTEEEGTPHGQE